MKFNLGRHTRTHMYTHVHMHITLDCCLHRWFKKLCEQYGVAGTAYYFSAEERLVGLTLALLYTD